MAHCGHLHPSEIGLIQLMPVVIWGNDEELIESVQNFVADEFGEYINIIRISEISAFDKKNDFERIEEFIMQFDYHLIHLKENEAILLKNNSEKTVLGFEEVEKTIGILCRELIQFYHQNKDL